MFGWKLLSELANTDCVPTNFQTSTYLPAINSLIHFYAIFKNTSPSKLVATRRPVSWGQRRRGVKAEEMVGVPGSRSGEGQVKTPKGRVVLVLVKVKENSFS